MEKFYIITDECGYKKDYLDYGKNTLDVNEVVKEFFTENNIDTSQYYVDSDKLYIVPTSRDIEIYDKLLNKPIQQGLRSFKKNSKIHKEFYKKIDDKGIKILIMPSVWMYMNGMYGHMRTTTSLVDNTMYLKLSTDYDREVNEKGFKEIKASEYYLAIESE